MTRKRLGAVDRESISIIRNAAEQTAAERRGGAVSKAPPIGQVAGTAARSIEEEMLRLRKERDGFEGDAAAYHEARRAGLVIEQIPLDRIDDHAYSRDRRHLDRDAESWLELKDSLRARGQQTPIEVTGPDSKSGIYRLVSGYRRLSALRDLFDETGDENFSTIKALVADRPETVDAMIAMVEENEIRENVSFYERGRICCLAAEQGVCASIDEAIQTLFGSSSRNRRYKIRNFTVIHGSIGSYLDYPEAIGERLGARLAQALKEGRGADLIAVLADRGKKFVDAGEEIALLEAFVGRKGAFASKKTAPKPAALSAAWDGQGGLRVQAKARPGRVNVEISGLSIKDEDALRTLLERIGSAALE